MSDKKPGSFRIVDHGSDHAQYFPGHGVAFTSYTDCATGCGGNRAEAFADALESLAQNGWDTSEIESSQDAKDTLASGGGEVEHDCTFDDIQDGCEHYYYVSIDVAEKPSEKPSDPKVKKLTEEQIERENVELVFSLGGGELETEPLVMAQAFRADGSEYVNAQTDQARGYRFAYWYEGVPDYAESQFSSGDRYRHDWHGSEFLTVIDLSPVYGTVPPVLIDSEGAIWLHVATFANSGERECPWRNAEDFDTFESDGPPVKAEHCNGPMEGVCAFCEANLGEGHGYVYLGDCAERVYEKVGEVRSKVRTKQVTLPAFLATALINGDTSGLADSDHKWLERAEELAAEVDGHFVDVGEETFFSRDCALAGWNHGADMATYTILYTEGEDSNV